MRLESDGPAASGSLLQQADRAHRRYRLNQRLTLGYLALVAGGAIVTAASDLFQRAAENGFRTGFANVLVMLVVASCAVMAVATHRRGRAILALETNTEAEATAFLQALAREELHWWADRVPLAAAAGLVIAGASFALVTLSDALAEGDAALVRRLLVVLLGLAITVVAVGGFAAWRVRRLRRRLDELAGRAAECALALT